MEISKVISEALQAAVMVELFPRAQIDVFIEVLQADAGTRIAGLTASAVALAAAGVPMRDLVVGCTAGKVDGKVVLDLSKEEDNFGQADLPVAIMPKSGKVVLMQMDGDLSVEEFNEATSMIFKATERINQIQRDALKKNYSSSAQDWGE
ncbi:exosome complex exonuclease 1 [mine drainage metagenome]|uniref:Exosome complex exonuclease 1 n=1 Tax=mine drainage metagenome TaxID=410659 RepID=T0ZN13_9ZZZZ